MNLPPATPKQLFPMRRNIFICLFLAGITLTVYWPVRNYNSVLYDDPFFLANDEVLSGVNGHSLLWTVTGTVVANWHPVTSLSFVLGHQSWGANPGAEHLVNVLFHALNALLLFLILNLATRATWRSAAVAALFAWHPLRVESVAWIAERKDVLSTFFMMLTLWAYVRYVRGVTSDTCQVTGPEKAIRIPHVSRIPFPVSRFYWLALVFFALGLMSKAMLVTVPFVLLLLDVWPLGRVTGDGWRAAGDKISEPQDSSPRRHSTLNPVKGRGPHGALRPQLSTLLLEKWPFFALAAVFCVITFLVQHFAGATLFAKQFGMEARLENAILSYLRYLAWTVWPTNLAVYYPFPINDHCDLALWPDWEIGAAVLLLAGVSALCLSQMVRRPYLAAGWFWYLVTLVPVIGLIQVGGQGMADRYTYIPLIGPVISLVWLVSEKWPSGIFSRGLLATLTTMILAAGILQTRHQLQFWNNTVSLFDHTVEVTGENSRSEFNLGFGLEIEGDISRAMVHYRNAMKSEPPIVDAFLGMGRLLSVHGKLKEAQEAYNALLAVEPDNFSAHLCLASILSHLGQKDEAVAHLKAALKTRPGTAIAMNDLAWTLATSAEAELRDGAQAVYYAKRACELTHYREIVLIGTLAAAYAEAGRFDEAIATAQKACDLASELNEQALLKRNRELLELYRKHQPYRDVANPEPPDAPAVNDSPDSTTR